jgi:hypothetical protein
MSTPASTPNALLSKGNELGVGVRNFPQIDRRVSTGPESLIRPVGSSNNLAALQDNGPQAFLPTPEHKGSFGGPSYPVGSPIAGAQDGPSKSLQILQRLPGLAEFHGVAHRASIDVMQDTAAGKIRKTGIVCTIGPKTNTPEALAGLRRNGMNIMRMNFSHGSHEYHGSVITNLHKSFNVYKDGPPVAIALDTKGPEIRTGNMAKGSEEVELQAGQAVTITVDIAFKNECTKDRIYVDYTNLPKVVSAGSLIYIDDGLISVKVTSTPDDKTVIGEVVNTGMISSHKGVNLPGTVVDLPSVSEQDKKDLIFGVEQGVDMIFASFIRKPEDVHAIREILGEKGHRIVSALRHENGTIYLRLLFVYSDCLCRFSLFIDDHRQDRESRRSCKLQSNPRCGRWNHGRSW